ncbi:MAG: DUF4124 domain-containing protein [Gallionella sp.]
MINYRMLIALICGITCSFPVAAKLYKWVDDKGTTHYGETVPPKYAGKDRVELNESGRVVNKKEVLTPQELQTQEQNEAKKKTDDKAALDQKRYDMTLTSTYSNVQEIDLARHRNLQQVNARITNNKSQLNIAEDNLLRLQKESEGYTQANKKIPTSLQDELQGSQERVLKLKQNLEKSLAEKAVVEAHYDADKVRYQELTGK